MTIEIAEEWYNNNVSGATGYTLDSENQIFSKTILEDDLTFEFSTDTDSEFVRKFFSVILLIWILRYHPEPYSSGDVYWIRYQWHNFNQVSLKQKSDNVEKLPFFSIRIFISVI